MVFSAGTGPLHIVGNVHTEFDEITSDEEDEGGDPHYMHLSGDVLLYCLRAL
jgi:hypothetical protein